MTNPLQPQITPLASARKKIRKTGTPVIMLEKRERYELTLYIETLEAQIVRLQAENERQREEVHWLKMTPDQQNADSANYISPGNWGGYT